jgi:hypothetical protein
MRGEAGGMRDEGGGGKTGLFGGAEGDTEIKRIAIAISMVILI